MVIPILKTIKTEVEVFGKNEVNLKCSSCDGLGHFKFWDDILQRYEYLCCTECNGRGIVVLTSNPT